MKSKKLPLKETREECFMTIWVGLAFSHSNGIMEVGKPLFFKWDLQEQRKRKNVE